MALGLHHVNQLCHLGLHGGVIGALNVGQLLHTIHRKGELGRQGWEEGKGGGNVVLLWWLCEVPEMLPAAWSSGC